MVREESSLRSSRRTADPAVVRSPLELPVDHPRGLVLKIREENRQRLVLSFTPWAPWAAGCIGGAVFFGFAVFAPFDLPLWARMTFGALGIAAPMAFLASHAAVQAVFDRSKGEVTISRMRPLGGVSRELVPLRMIAAVEEVVETDVDNTSFHRIELVLGHQGGACRTSAGSRVHLTTGPVSIDQSEVTRRIARWLGASRHD